MHWCRNIRTRVWGRVLGFLTEIELGTETLTRHEAYTEKAIIFGIWPNGKLGPELARGVMRHTWQAIYKHFTMACPTVDNHTPWNPDHVIRDTFTTVVRALRRAAHEITLEHYRGKYAGGDTIRPERLDKYKPLAEITDTGDIQIHPLLQDLMAHFGIE